MRFLKEDMYGSNDEALAKYLGITQEDIKQLEYTIEENASDDGLIYSFHIKFDDDSPAKVLQRIPGLKHDNSIEVSPTVFTFNDYEYEYEYDARGQFDAISHNDAPLHTFREEIDNLNQLVELRLEPHIMVILYKQIFINVIGLMEAFLSDTFINLTLKVDFFFRNFIKSHPDFSKRKFDLCDIFDQEAKLKDTAKIVMLDLIYHRLPEVREMYRSTFGITFPSIQKMVTYVRDRHDLVHRNGKTKDGLLLIIDERLLEALISDTTAFVEEIAQSVAKVYDETVPF